MTVWDLSTTGEISKAASVLEAQKIIAKEQRDDGMYVDLNTDGLDEVRETAARQRKTEKVMASVQPSAADLPESRFVDRFVHVDPIVVSLPRLLEPLI